MKKIFCILTLFMVLLLTQRVLALEDISLNIDIPKEVRVGENFKIDVYVNLSRNVSGFECKIDTPIYVVKYIKFTNATGNREIKEKAGEFYMLDLKNNSVFISFILFDKPLNSDFHLITVEGKALKEGVVSIKFDAVVSDENGRAIRLSPITYNLEVVNSGQDINEKTESGKESNIFSWIIEIILNFLKTIFGD